jgi:hypothetical protein
VCVLSAHEIALKRLYYGICIPLGSVVVSKQILDARPTPQTIELARIALIKKFTMPLAHVLFVFLTVFDFHRTPLVRLATVLLP